MSTPHMSASATGHILVSLRVSQPREFLVSPILDRMARVFSKATWSEPSAHTDWISTGSIHFVRIERIEDSPPVLVNRRVINPNSTMSLVFDSKWCEPISFNDARIMVGRDRAFVIGTLLILRCTSSNRVLMGRKSFRDGFEGSNQLTLPGGMIRAESAHFNTCVAQTLEKRVREETGVSLAPLKKLLPLDEQPPVVARYTVKGKKVSAAILPFYGEVATELPATSRDSRFMLLVGTTRWISLIRSPRRTR